MLMLQNLIQYENQMQNHLENQSLEVNQSYDLINHLENQSLEVNQSQDLIQGYISNQNPNDKNIMIRKGYWTIKEEIQYYYHIKENYAHYEGIINRRVTKIYKALALKMKTRLPQQVRSHHQKMMKKYQTLENLILKLQIQLFKNKTVRQTSKKQTQQLKQNIQQKQHQQTTTTMFPQQENISFFINQYDEILQTPIRFDDYFFSHYQKSSNSVSDQMFPFD